MTIPATFYTSLLRWSYLDGAVASAIEGLDLDFIPAALRRRCSPFTKMTLAVAHACVRSGDYGDTPSVFASAHGEASVTAQLLGDLTGNQSLSPMGFSLSVHNSSSGIYSISSQNKAPSTALAAGEYTFLMGLLETLLQVRSRRGSPVLYVCSDELIPEVFLPPNTSQPEPVALALLIGEGQGGVPLTVQINNCDATPIHASGWGHTAHFSSWLQGRDQEWVGDSHSMRYTISSSPDRVALSTSPARKG